MISRTCSAGSSGSRPSANPDGRSPPGHGRPGRTDGARLRTAPEPAAHRAPARDGPSEESQRERDGLTPAPAPAPDRRSRRAANTGRDRTDNRTDRRQDTGRPRRTCALHIPQDGGQIRRTTESAGPPDLPVGDLRNVPVCRSAGLASGPRKLLVCGGCWSAGPTGPQAGGRRSAPAAPRGGWRSAGSAEPAGLRGLSVWGWTAVRSAAPRLSRGQSAAPGEEAGRGL